MRRRRRWCSGPAEPGKRGPAEGRPWPRPDPRPGLSLALAWLPPARSLRPDPSSPAARRPGPVPPPIPSLPSGPAPPETPRGNPPPSGEGPRCSVAPRWSPPARSNALLPGFDPPEGRLRHHGIVGVPSRKFPVSPPPTPHSGFPVSQPDVWPPGPGICFTAIPTMRRSFLDPRKSWEFVEGGEVEKGAALRRASGETETACS